MKTIKLKDPIFKISLTIFIGKPEEANPTIEDRFGEDCMVGDLHFGKFLADGKTCLIYLKELNKTPYSLGVLTHELNHLIVHIADVFGMTISIENDEIFAHIQEYFVREILKKIK